MQERPALGSPFAFRLFGKVPDIVAITPLMPVYPRCGVRPVRGEGAYLIGERGERYPRFRERYRG